VIIPKEVPCVHCGSSVVVVVRDAADGFVKYVGAKCHQCGMYLFATGQSEESPNMASKNALADLRRAWGSAKKELELIRAEVLEATGREDGVVEVYRDGHAITAARCKQNRR